ncbi:hypothetical protein Scep_021497 [Stephania cephalantha]|uniref:Uncharacterized protein n=1 Tax=Stephania cephalantha TaxID=152367 RepID=A0AAP0HWW8_9MAGN
MVESLLRHRGAASNKFIVAYVSRAKTYAGTMGKNIALLKLSLVNTSGRLSGYGSSFYLGRYYDTYLPFLLEACNDKSIDVGRSLFMGFDDNNHSTSPVNPPLPALSWLKLRLHSSAFDVPLHMRKLWTIYLVCR